jgi:signal transduction histidine kinase
MQIASKYRWAFFLLFFQCLSLNVFSQGKQKKPIQKPMAGLIKKIDSLFSDAQNAINNHDIKKAEEDLDICLKIATDNELNEQKLQCQFYFGSLYSDLKEYTQAVNYFNEGLEIAVNLNDYDHQVHFNEKLASAFMNLKDYNHAKVHYLLLVDLYSSRDNSYGLANTYSNLGSLSFAQRDTEKAQEYLAKASAIFNSFRKIETIKERDYSVEAQGLERELTQDKKKASENEKIVSGNQKNEEKGTTDVNAVAKSLLKIANVYKEIGHFKKAHKHFRESLHIFKNEKNYHAMAEAVISLGDISLTLKDYTTAKKYFYMSLNIAETNNLKISLMESYKGLSFVLSMEKDYKNAYDYYQKYIGERDLIYEEEKEAELQKLRAKMNIEKQDIEIKLLKKEQEVSTLTLEKDHVWFMTMLASIFFLILMIGLIYNRYRLKKELNKALEVKNLNMQKLISELKESETQLSDLNKTKDQFFSIISHDLKAPINTMKGYLSLVKSFPENFSVNDIKDFANKMDVSVKNLSQLLNNLLEWAMVQTGAIKTQIEKFEVTELINQKIELFAPQIASKDIKLTFTGTNKINTLADKNMIDFVIRNLLHNAIKFTKTGGSITIETYSTTKKVFVKITDSGIGMEKSAVNAIFDAQNRIIQEGTNKERGSGLGLILCHDFITRNNGNITVESSAGKGSSFTVELPGA